MTQHPKTFLSDEVGVRLTPELRAALEQAAFEERRKPSVLVRIWIEDELKRRSAGASHAAA